MTVLAYAGSLSGGYVYEDLTPIPTFPAWQGWSTALTAAVHLPTRSIATLSRDLTRAWIGDSPAAARTVSLAWHLLNGLLLWWLVACALAPVSALCALAMFLLLPIQAESVAYVASRPELVAATWVLLALLASARGWVWLAGICAALAITGKEVAVMAWVLVPLWAWQTGQTWSRRALLAWGVGGGVCLTLFGLAVQARGWLVLPSLPYLVGQLTQAARLLFLVPEALLRPHALTIDHDWTTITRPIAYGVAAAWLMALAWTRGWVRFALIWTLIALLPRLVLPMPEGLHERHVYIAMLGWSLAIGAVVAPREGRYDDTL